MNPLLLELLPLIKDGYCCSQLLVHLLLQGAGQENPQLLRAMHALCFGMGGSEATCGLLTGGACVIGCFAGRGASDESAHQSLAPMVHEYQQWFKKVTQCDGTCHHVLENIAVITNMSEQPTQKHDQVLCGHLLAQCWEKILELLEQYDVNMELKP